MSGHRRPGLWPGGLGHDHEHGQDHDEHAHPHAHPHGGVRGFLHDLFVPHTHDSAASIDDAMEASAAGIRALKISLLVLLATTVLQAIVVAFTGSVALLADTIHNFADALTAVPLWIAFVLGRRAADRRYTYGYGRAEDLAGMFIVFVVALSAAVAGWQAIDRFIFPRPIEHPWLLVAAGLIGFVGNEVVAIYRIRVGRRIGSAALVADGVHARLDGFTSLSVVLGAIGILLGFPLADPIIGLLISVSIMILLGGTVRAIGARLMDAIDPALVKRAEQALARTTGVEVVGRVRLRWVGHRLTGSATVEVDAVDLAGAGRIAAHAAAHVRQAVGNVDDFTVIPAVRSPRRTAEPEDVDSAV
ncbi:cation diffusion facilitator family transporter [Microbacterium sp. VKM Ac-2923]|uniref:cation diffusion facilitator family transporter n=1 Tax=Microbacterium sp. VKM Ac-2923 TaxID=2929476 RepID=UPI001FB54031|nr:cation diffusion facilitator family transporter [Microbacterium sp. VKM Ac-2923]MCJ1709478.1 cation diffusion facilitator family transporter [Microbacterium sp. VKM Ac-2923]